MSKFSKYSVYMDSVIPGSLTQTSKSALNKITA